MKTRTLYVIAALLTLSLWAFALQTTRSVRDGVYSEEQRKRGSALFADNCAMCHNHDLSGGEIAPALYGGNFMANWDGLTVGDLFERIRVSMPPDNPDKISSQQRSDIISLILSVNGFPAGSKDLESRVEFLKQIKIEPPKGH